MRPRAIDVKPIENYKLIVTFSNKEKRIFDVTPYLKYKQFKKLKKISIFKTVRIDGLSIVWINGTDICPDELYNNSIKIDGEEN